MGGQGREQNLSWAFRVEGQRPWRKVRKGSRCREHTLSHTHRSWSIRAGTEQPTQPEEGPFQHKLTLRTLLPLPTVLNTRGGSCGELGLIGVCSEYQPLFCFRQSEVPLAQVLVSQVLGCPENKPTCLDCPPLVSGE